MENDLTQRAFLDRIRLLEQWLADKAPYVQFDQHHLNAGSPQQAYWHVGYLSALRDVVSFNAPASLNRPDKSNPPLPDDAGE